MYTNHTDTDRDLDAHNDSLNDSTTDNLIVLLAMMKTSTTLVLRMGCWEWETSQTLTLQQRNATKRWIVMTIQDTHRNTVNVNRPGSRCQQTSGLLVSWPIALTFKTNRSREGKANLINLATDTDLAPIHIGRHWIRWMYSDIVQRCRKSREKT